jgi:hypothetical protein
MDLATNTLAAAWLGSDPHAADGQQVISLSRVAQVAWNLDLLRRIAKRR